MRLRAKPNRWTFTDIALQQLSHPKQGQVLHWDKKSIGLSLLVGKRTKTFRSSYKLNGQWTGRSLGRFGEVTLAEARALVLEDRRNASQGIDPDAPTPASSTTTYEAVVDRFVEMYAKPNHRTWVQTQCMLKSCKDWLHRPIAEITKKDAYELLDPIVASGHGPKADVTLSWLRKLWRWSWDRDIVTAPVMDAVKIQYAPRIRDRVYSDAELKSIWNAANKLGGTEAAYIKLLILTAPRKTALARMRWADVRDGIWITPFADTKTRKTAKPRTYTTPLPALARAILHTVPIAGQFVFQGRCEGLPLSPDVVLINKLVRSGAPKDFTYHATRHTVATWLQNHGHSMFEIGLVLNHADGGVTAGYSHGHPLELKKALLEEWASHVEQFVPPEGQPLDSNVVPLTTATKRA
jgi:integrase